MYNKCDVCLNRRTIVSENGYHTICSLSSKKATDCLICKKKLFYVRRKKDEKRKDLFNKFNKVNNQYQ